MDKNISIEWVLRVFLNDVIDVRMAIGCGKAANISIDQKVKDITNLGRTAALAVGDTPVRLGMKEAFIHKRKN